MDRHLYKASIRNLKEQFGFDFVGIANVLEGPHPLLTWTCGAGNKNERFRRIVLESGKGIAGGVYKTRRAMVIQNAAAELTMEEQVNHPIVLTEELLSLMALPLWLRDTVQGVLLVAFRRPEQITRELFDAVLAAVCPSFCEFVVHPCEYDSVLHSSRGMAVDPVPIYEVISWQILEAQEEERRHIARELHDSVVQELLGIQMLLRSVKYQPNQAQMLALLEDADIQMNQIQTHLREISASLRPPALDDLGLAAALRSHFLWIKNSMGMLVHFTENINTARYPEVVEISFYRVCQEAVLNACKYSGCEEMDVSLHEADGIMTLLVTDHGSGISVRSDEDFGSGVGIRSMAERAELINGDFHIVTEPDSGTSIWMSAAVERRELQ